MRVGSKVVCINDAMQPHTVETLKKDVPNWIKKGQQYTIRNIVEIVEGTVVGVHLEEVYNMPLLFKFRGSEFLMEPTFQIDRFREVEPQKIAVEVEEEVCQE